MDLLLREFLVNDVPEAAKIYVDAYADKNWNENWTLIRATRRLSELVSNPCFKGFIALLDGDVAGCALCEVLTWFNGKQLEIKELFVAPSFQGHGIGRKLVEHIEALKADMDVSESILWTNTCPTLIEFYSRLGFKQEGNVVRFIK